MIIYVDQLFLENFIMNYIILYITGKISNTSFKWYRLGLGAFIGSIYVVLSFVFLFYDKQILISKIVLAFIMVIISFKIKNIKDFIKDLLCFLGITFLIGGTSFALSFMFNSSIRYDGKTIYIEEIPIIIIAVSCLITFTIGKWTYLILKNKAKINLFIYDVDIFFYDKKITTKVFLDSGNNIVDIYTGLPVIIVEKDILKNIIPKDIINKSLNNNFDFNEKWKKRFRILPFSTIDSSNILISFKSDKCIIYSSEEKCINNVLIGVCERKLDKSNNYFGLMGNILDIK